MAQVTQLAERIGLREDPPMELPETMRAVVLDEAAADLEQAVKRLRVAQRPVPRPGRGEVLVRVEAAPCNPSDLISLQGKYVVRKSFPSIPGWEGAGQVVASGPGWLGSWLKDKRVACALEGDRDGTWAEYVVTRATMCIPLNSRMTYRQAAGLIVNPLTALGLLETARRGGHRAAVFNAAASQLGRMVLAIARENDYPLVCVVRREEQAELVRSLGATVVLNSSDEDFERQLATVCEEREATIAFDAVAGTMTGVLLKCLPPRGHVCVYGALADEPCGEIDPGGLIVGDKTISGFYLPNWLRGRNLLRQLWAANRVQRLILEGCIETKVQRRVALEEVGAGIRQYCEHMTDGKIHLVPQKQPRSER